MNIENHVYGDGQAEPYKEPKETQCVSECCGALPSSNGDADTKDAGICPECGEHCEYIDVHF